MTARDVMCQAHSALLSGNISYARTCINTRIVADAINGKSEDGESIVLNRLGSLAQLVYSRLQAQIAYVEAQTK